MKKILFLILSVIVCFTNTMSVWAVEIGEDVSFSASVIEGNSNGSTNTEEKTEQEKQWGAVNSGNNSYIEDIAKSIIKELIETEGSDFIKRPDSIIVVTDGTTNASDLKDIAEKSDEYYPGGSGFNIKDNRLENTGIILNDQQMGVIKDVVLENGFPEIDGELKRPVPITKEPIEDTDTKYSVVVLPGDIEIIDYTNFEERYTALEEYLKTVSESERISVTHILEVKAESVTEATLWSEIPQTWEGTSDTHFWQFKCVESFGDDGQHPSLQRFGGNNMVQRFNYPGRYHVTASQILERTYCKAISYSVNEYLILSDTGDVIWKNESKGVTDLATNKTTAVTSRHIKNVKNYKELRKDTVYVTVYDSEITVNNTGWSSQISASSVWDTESETRRTE